MEKVFDVVRSWMLSCCSCSIEISRAAVVVGMNGNVVCKEKEGEKQATTTTTTTALLQVPWWCSTEVNINCPQDDLEPRKVAILHLMRCVCQMARVGVFNPCAGYECVFASRYLSEPETDAWGALAMILSITYSWMQDNSVACMDQETLLILTCIVSVCIKFSCGDDACSLKYMGVYVGCEVRILGILYGMEQMSWFESVYLHARELQNVLDSEVMSILHRVPLCRHYMENAQAKTERMLFDFYESKICGAIGFDMDALYKALRALPTFFFACVYENLLIVKLPERHAQAMMFAILASGEYTNVLADQATLIIWEIRAVLASVLRSAPKLPMGQIFATGGTSPNDEWATRSRVWKAFESLSE